MYRTVCDNHYFGCFLFSQFRVSVDKSAHGTYPFCTEYWNKSRYIDSLRQRLINRITKPFPTVSSGDSVDWKEPTPEEITRKVLDGTKSGSILLFHNDLENTTEALPDILSQLKSEGYEFVTVSDLIYHENYTIDSNGKQIPDVLSSLELTPENVEDVMAQYADVIASAGFSDEQIAQAAQAIKDGSTLPDDVIAVINSIDPSILTYISTTEEQNEKAIKNK